MYVTTTSARKFIFSTSIHLFSMPYSKDQDGVVDDCVNHEIFPDSIFSQSGKTGPCSSGGIWSAFTNNSVASLSKIRSAFVRSIFFRSFATDFLNVIL